LHADRSERLRHPWRPPLTGPDTGFLKRILAHPTFILPRDFSLFLVSARTDAAIERTRAKLGARAAFEEAYTRSHDPWRSAAPRYRYQQLKYEQIMALLPAGRFRRVLDLGCGLGLLSQRLAQRSDAVLGLDVAAAAVGHARERAAGIANVSFEQADILDLPASLDAAFDLVVVADTLYYLSPLGDDLLKTLSARLARLLAPGGVLLLANHFFFSADPDSRLTRRIHDAFTWSPHLSATGHHRRSFFLATLLEPRDAGLAHAAL
jgi:SAM-dependent methyltransferase